MISSKYESESFAFGVDYLINQLSVEMRASMEAVTNGQTIEWYKVKLENGKILRQKSKLKQSNFLTSLLKTKTRIKKSLKNVLETS